MSQSRHGPDVQLEAIERARSVLRQGLTDAGCRSFADVWRAVLERGLAAAGDERTFRRIYNGETLNPRVAGYRAAEALASLTADPQAVVAEFQRCWSLQSSEGSGRGGRLRSNWFAVVPRQEGRPFASVDQIVVGKQTEMTLSGDILRVLPDSPHEAGLKWHFRGVRGGDGTIFLTFRPVGPNNEVSTGVIYMARNAFRTERYEGSYVRREKSGGEFATRSYGWYQKVPQTALPRVALLDLDNTLRSGWSIRAWVEFLAGCEVEGAYKCLDRIDAALDAFQGGLLSHDTLSNETAQAYASMLKGNEQAKLKELAADFVAGKAEMHAFVVPLISRLEKLSVAPIIVSGGPAELVSEYTSILEVEEFCALTLGVGADGCFDGSIVSNPGLASVKRRVTGEFRAQFRSVVLALGDSDSDLPMLQAARYRVIVGGLAEDLDWPAESFVRVDPVAATGYDLLTWLNERIEPDERFGPSGNLDEDLMKEPRATSQRARRPGQPNT